MFEARIKTIVKYILIVQGEEIPFSTKKDAIKNGVRAIKIDESVKMVKREILWWLKANDTKILSKEDYDYTNLIKILSKF
jgi:hypothetical protein